MAKAELPRSLLAVYFFSPQKCRLIENKHFIKTRGFGEPSSTMKGGL